MPADPGAPPEKSTSPGLPALSGASGGAGPGGTALGGTALGGTASLTVPVTTSPGRAGFGPSVSLSYDSGAGNGPFGLGWKVSLPAITLRRSALTSGTCRSNSPAR